MSAFRTATSSANEPQYMKPGLKLPITHLRFARVGRWRTHRTLR